MTTGRLELTWVNKDKTLISTGEGRYDYEWVDPSDLRAREVRLVDEVATISAPDARPTDCDLPAPTEGNLLVTGDALHVLDALAKTPELAKDYVGKVKLVYIDPPFNTGQAFEHYEDNLEHSVWLTMLRDRIRQMLPLLARDASVWVHLDDAEAHRMRSVLDETLGAENFVATVVWQKADSPRNSARHFSVDQDYVIVYARDANTWRPNPFPRDAAVDAKYRNPDNDTRGRWFGDNLRANKPYSLGLYTVTGPTGKEFTVPPGRFWRISKARFDELDADGRIYWGPDGSSFPTYKRFLSDVGDLVPRTWWTFLDVGSNRTSKAEIKALFPGEEPFSTPKPERLLERIVSVSTNPGDIVLDFYAGSGSTAAVAHKMGRRWVTCELSSATIEKYTLPRLAAVVRGDDLGGVTAPRSVEAVGDLPDGVTPEMARYFTTLLGKFAKQIGAGDSSGDDEAFSSPEIAETVRALRAAAKTREVTTTRWYGGGSFRHMAVAPSMFETIDGIVYLASWARGGDLARAVAAQFGYVFDESRYPFSGRKARRLLAVVDGTAGAELVEHITGELADGETVAIYATSLDPEARSGLPRGCTLDKVPAAILETYRRSVRAPRSFDWAASLAEEGGR